MSAISEAKAQLTNYANYGFYKELVDTQYQTIDANIFTRNNIDDHFNSIMAILSDGIETNYVQNMMIHLIFTDGVDCELTITEYLFSLMFFTLPLEVGEKIDSDKLFYVEDITQKEICRYIDDKFPLWIEPCRK